MPPSHSAAMEGHMHLDDSTADRLPYGFHEPEPGFPLDDQNAENFAHGLQPFGVYSNAELPDFDGVENFSDANLTHQPMNSKSIQDHVTMETGSQAHNPSMWHRSNPSSHSDFAFGAAPPPPSVQSQIASERKSVGQRFGQVTPPDEIVKSGVGVPPKRPRSSSEEADAQRQRQERARNAAHTRYARNSSNRKARKDSREDDNVDDGEDEDGPVDGKREKYREKNRVAAAKCRSKKKASVNDLEERHRVVAAENNYRRRQERELRDQLTTLRTMALEHGPDRCRCGDVHKYNQSKAAEMAFGHRFGGGSFQNMGSPSQESASSALSPLSDLAPAFDGRRASVHGAMDSGMMHAKSSATETSRRPEHDGAMETNPMTNEQMFGLNMSHDDFPMFADFLQSSPGGGNAGFV